MKKLLLCRHAKSSWDDPFLPDHKRPLAPRGIRDAPKMAKRLEENNIFPDSILSSDAVRARETAYATADGLGFSRNNVILNPKLYHASGREILNEIKKTADTVTVLFVFGHNPGFNDLIGLLGGEIDNLPTCGQYGFLLDIEKWLEINRSNAKTWMVDYPKKGI